VLPPLTVTIEDPRDPIEVTWWPQQWIEIKRVRVWRVRTPPPMEGVVPLRPPEVRTEGLITPLFRLVAFAVAERERPCNVPLDAVEFTQAIAAPGARVMLRLDAAGLGAAAEVVIAVSVELPPPCFRPRAAA